MHRASISLVNPTLPQTEGWYIPCKLHSTWQSLRTPCRYLSCRVHSLILYFKSPPHIIHCLVKSIFYVLLLSINFVLPFPFVSCYPVQPTSVLQPTSVHITVRDEIDMVTFVNLLRNRRGRRFQG